MIEIHNADPDPCENTKAHDVTEVHEADSDAARYVVELEPGVWYCGGSVGDPPRTCHVRYATMHTYRVAMDCLAHARRYREFRGAQIVRVDMKENKK